MAFSCSDFTAAVFQRLVELNLIDPLDLVGDDLEQQAKLVTKTFGDLANKVTSLANLFAQAKAPSGIGSHDFNRAGGWRDQVAAVLNDESVKRVVAGAGAVFMREVLEANETLTDIADRHGVLTLADVTYLLSAINNGTYIDYFPTSQSEILDVVSALPSAALWMQFIQVSDK